MKKIKDFLTKIVQTDSKESSKRFLAIFCGLVGAITTFIYTDAYNLSFIVGMWLSAMLTLLGVASWEKIKKDEK